MSKTGPHGAEIPFIISNPAKGSNDEERKLIRSHVMRGKNRKKIPPRPSSWINGRADCHEGDLWKNRLSYAPTKVGGEFSLTPFSAEMTPRTLETIRKLRYAMFPLQLGWPSEKTEASWFEPIWRDVACLHFTLFTTNTYLSTIYGHEEDRDAALVHFSEALSILQKRLDASDDALSVSDTTILIVVGLTMAATALGDFETAAKHLSGLHKMVALRGGLSSFQGKKLLQAKICRADLEVTISTGCKPLICSKDFSWGSYLSSSRQTLVSSTSGPTTKRCAAELEGFLGRIDTRLRLVWLDLAEFVRAVNIARQTRLDIDSELYMEAMVSIHYRLLYLRYDVGDVCEAVRLGLLAFASTLFLQWRDIKTRFEHLARRFRHALSLLRYNKEVMPAELRLWLYMAGPICVFDDAEAALYPALIEVLRYLQLTTWEEVKQTMKTILWVDFLHDFRGKSIVKAVLVDSRVGHG
ncbi:putative Transcription factor domain-containing protein [Seiridium cardinale]|uniref:Transcription factor domain-containing protein n=1 Tax=Seiridium cardinale TaxID=138064 RepID=A0ABR2XBH2_9PEZI